jgi:hypothetical protein
VKTKIIVMALTLVQIFVGAQAFAQDSVIESCLYSAEVQVLVALSEEGEDSSRYTLRKLNSEYIYNSAADFTIVHTIRATKLRSLVGFTSFKDFSVRQNVSNCRLVRIEQINNVM